MATKRDLNMYEVYNDYKAINTYTFICTCRFNSQSEASVHGHGI